VELLPDGTVLTIQKIRAGEQGSFHKKNYDARSDVPPALETPRSGDSSTTGCVRREDAQLDARSDKIAGRGRSHAEQTGAALGEMMMAYTPPSKLSSTAWSVSFQDKTLRL
jgi:hypothetical protein